MKKEIRTARLDLSDPFAGQHIVIRTNPRMRVFRGLASGNLEKMLDALALMSIESNLTDEDDQPIDVTTADGWSEVNQDALEYIADQIVEALKVPKANANGSSTQPLPDKELSPPISAT